ncbi:MAG: carbon storage regulator [Pirellulaceae bacterium]|nr:carbon storage regulator [Pirellulaceae bacterium]
MLILSRKVGEQILLGKDVILTIVKTSTGTVRIGITAPPEVTIARGELIERTISKPPDSSIAPE